MSNPNHDPKTGEFTSGPGGGPSIRRGRTLKGPSYKDLPSDWSRKHLANLPNSELRKLRANMADHMGDPQRMHQERVVAAELNSRRNTDKARLKEIRTAADTHAKGIRERGAALARGEPSHSPGGFRLSREQEQDKSIPSSAAAYRERIYQARTKRLRSK